MHYDKLIKNWHIKASEEDYFSKFVFEYLAFIAFLKKKKFTICKTDRDAIQRLKLDNQIKKVYLDKIPKIKELFSAWNNIITELREFRLGDASRSGDEVSEIKWWNCSHLQFYDKTDKEERKTKGVIHSLDDWENMVEFLYTIRNNLFHGSKDPEDQRDQIIVKNGYIALRELVENLLAGV